MINLDDKDTEELNNRLEIKCIVNLLLEVIKRNHEDLIYDIDFIILDKALDFNSYKKILIEVLGKYQKEFIKKGTIPKIEDIHEKLIDIISANDEFLDGLSHLNKYDLDFTKKFLKKIKEKDEVFTFLNKMDI